MLYFVMNAVGFVLLAMVALHSIVLHVRLHRLRHALPDAGRVLPSLDASVSRMVEIAEGFAQRLQNDLSTVEVRLAASRRMSAELAAANRAAEETTCALDRLLRQHRRMEGVRAAAIPRELAEPKGFAERAGVAA
jgi:hypothetical protein